MLPQTHTSSKDGLASFVLASPDYELAPVGLGSFREQADRLAEFGRNGDIYVVHAAEGETVVPMEVLEANPQVKELLFNQMRDMGLDPNEYVVGDNLNSINPYTGMPEFFFKSIFNAVKRVVKFAAPIVVPMVAGAVAGPLGSMLASAALTKIQGGSWGDVLKGAALSYAGGAIMEGIGGAMAGTSLGDALGYTAAAGEPTTFFGGLQRGLAAPFTASSLQKLNPANWGSRAAQLGSQAAAAGSQLVEDPLGAFDPTRQYDILGPSPAGTGAGEATSGAARAARDAAAGTKPVDFGPQDLGRVMGPPPPPPTEGRGFWNQVQDWSPFAEKSFSLPDGRTAYGPDAVTAAEKAYMARVKRLGITPTEAGLATYLDENLGPSIYKKYGPSLGLASLGAATLGAFDAQEDDVPALTEEQLAVLQQNPFLADPATRGQFVISPINLNPYRRLSMRAANGGLVQGFPDGGSVDYTRYQGGYYIPVGDPQVTKSQSPDGYEGYETTRTGYKWVGPPGTATDPNKIFYDTTIQQLWPYQGVVQGDSRWSTLPADSVIGTSDLTPELVWSNGGGDSGSGDSGVDPREGWDTPSPEPVPWDTSSPELIPLDPSNPPPSLTSPPGGWETFAAPAALPTPSPAALPTPSPAALSTVGWPASSARAVPYSPVSFGQTPLQGYPEYARPQLMNYGGTAQYPRREMLVEGSGTERSDDIPAMLSDGEFVLNARSVRGADPMGRGDRYRGAKNLYDMMRNFEMRA